MANTSALAASCLGGGVTLASTFAPALGLSFHQQRIGFAVGIFLMLIGGALYLYQRLNRSGGAIHRSPNASASTTHKLSDVEDFVSEDDESTADTFIDAESSRRIRTRGTKHKPQEDTEE
jgi:hypothetical protein